jgi:hypothetical protein
MALVRVNDQKNVAALFPNGVYDLFRLLDLYARTQENHKAAAVAGPEFLPAIHYALMRIGIRT